MTQYYVQRERTADFTVRATQGANSEILLQFTSAREAYAYVKRLNRMSIANEQNKRSTP